MADFTLMRERHAHHMSAVATGVTMTGPLGDGMVNLVFHRDGAKIIKEIFDSEEEKIPGGTALKIKNQKGSPETEYFREEVVTLLIPADKFPGFAQAIQLMANNMEAARRAPGTDG